MTLIESQSGWEFSIKRLYESSKVGWVELSFQQASQVANSKQPAQHSVSRCLATEITCCLVARRMPRFTSQQRHLQAAYAMVTRQQLPIHKLART